MSDYLATFTDAIRDRLAGNSTLRSALAAGSGSIRWYEQDRDAAMPFVTVAMQAMDATSSVQGFTKRAERVEIDVHVYVDAQSDNGSTPTNGNETLGSISYMVKGDWHEQSSGLPTYGFDRWQPTLTGSGWDCTSIMLEQTAVLNEPGILHHVHTFVCHVSVSKA